MRMLWSWPPIREALNECGYFHGIICFHTVKKLLSSTTTPGSFFLVRCQLSVVRMRRYAFTLWVVIDENECKSIDIHFRKSMGFYIGDLINEAYYVCEDDDNDLVNAEVKWLPTLFALIDSMTSPKGLFDCTGWYKQEEDGQPVPLQLQLTTPIYRPSRRCPSLQFSCVKAINRIVRYGGGGDVEKTYGEVPPHIREMLSVYPCTVWSSSAEWWTCVFCYFVGERVGERDKLYIFFIITKVHILLRYVFHCWNWIIKSTWCIIVTVSLWYFDDHYFDKPTWVVLFGSLWRWWCEKNDRQRYAIKKFYFCRCITTTTTSATSKIKKRETTLITLMKNIYNMKFI